MFDIVQGNDARRKTIPTHNIAPHNGKPQLAFAEDKTLQHIDSITQAAQTEWQREDSELQQVFASGKRIRQMAEEEHHNRTQLSLQPPTSWKSGGLLAGISALAGFNMALFNRFICTDPHPIQAIASHCTEPEHRHLPQTAMESAATHAPPTVPTAETIEQALVDFLHIENRQPGKETLVASVASWILPDGHESIATYQTHKLARRILLASGLYGGKQDERISPQLVKAVIRDWVFRTVFHTSLREYIAKKIIDHPTPSQLTLRDINSMISLASLYEEGLLQKENIPLDKLNSFNKMWVLFTREEIPVLDDLKFNDIQSKTFSEYDFLATCTGAEYFAYQDKISQTSRQGITLMGAEIWGEMSNQDVRPGALTYLITPALLSMAQTSPNVVRDALKHKNYAQFIVPPMLNSWHEAQQRAQKIESTFADWQQAAKAWDNKGKLAEKFVNMCPSKDIIYLRDRADDVLPPYEIERKKRLQAKENYLLWDKAPCKKEGVPPSLTDEYQRLTQNVADSWEKLDRKLLFNLFYSKPDDYNFIFSPLTMLRPVSLDMRTYRTPASGMGGMGYSNDVFISLDNTDLFSAQTYNEERLYAIKKEEGEEGEYKLHLVNRDINLYIKLGLLSHKFFWKDYTIEEGEVISGNYIFKVKITTNPKTLLSGNTASGEPLLIDYFCSLHNIRMYNALYEAGNDKSKAAKVWDVVKSMIPFYDCMEGLTSGDYLKMAQSLPVCLIDALSVFPVTAQATMMNGKYGLSLAAGIRSGVLKAGQGASLKAVARATAAGIVLPTRAEAQELLLNILQVMDFGLEQLYKKSLTAKRSGINLTGNTSYKKAKLPGNGPEVSVKNAGHDTWVMVDPQTGEGVGQYYHLTNGELREIDIRYNRPEVASFPDSSPPVKRHKPQDASTSSLNHQLPPAPSQTDTWNSVRKIIDNASPEAAIPLATVTNTAIQKLDSLIHPPRLKLQTTEEASHFILQRINRHMGDTPWQAYSGIKPNDVEKIPPHIAWMQQNLYAHIKKSNKKFAKARAVLNDLPQGKELLTTKPGRYLSQMINTLSPEIIYEACNWISEIADNGLVFLNTLKKVKYKNIVTISTELKHQPDSALKYISTLESDRYSKMPIALVAPIDPEARLFFFADRILHPEFSGVPGGINAGYNTETLSILTEYINHEVTHLSANLYDVFVHRYPPAGKRSSGKDVKDRFDEMLTTAIEGQEKPIIYQQAGFHKFMDHLKATQGISTEIAPQQTVESIFADQRLYASLLLSDAQTLATIIRDLADKRSFSAVIEA